MKLINNFLMVLLAVFVFSSCENFVGGDINEDPNNPTAVPIGAQMAAIQIALADNYGGDFSRFNSMLTQQVEGVERQWVAFNQYTGLTPNRFDDAWRNTYENILNELAIAKTSAIELELFHYQGIVNVMEAHVLMSSTDVWDNMPYTQALQGIDEPSPAYDSQADIYASVYRLLDEAVTLLNGPSGTVFPGSDDLFYGGDVSLWAKAAKAIKARGLMKDGDYAGAMSNAMASFESAADNMAYQYPDASAAGPWYRFNDGREGDIEFHPTIRGIMQGLNDTMRLAQYDQTFVVAHPYLVPDFLQELVTYREMQFIIAECEQRLTGSTTVAENAYVAGITASFARAGVPDAAADYIAQADVLTSGSLTLEQVMTQKYLGMFLQPEVYSDWRRTGIPSLDPVSGTTIPVRWDYSSTEYLFNSNSPSETETSIFNDKVGWNR